MPFTYTDDEGTVNVDLLQLRFPVYPGINDQPRYPTSERAGNGSDVVSRVNTLLQVLDALLTVQIQENTSNQIFRNNIPITIESLQDVVGRLVSQSTPQIGVANVLTQNMVWFVDPLSGSDQNDGMSNMSAFQTISKASQVAASYMNTNPFSIYARVIHLQPGTHEGANLSPFTSLNETDTIKIRGSNNGINNVFVGVTKGLSLYGFGCYSFENMIIRKGSSDRISLKVNKGFFRIGKVLFKFNDYDQIVVENRANLRIYDNYFVEEGCQNHLVVNDYSKCIIQHQDSDSNIVIRVGSTDVAGTVNFNNFWVVSKFSYLQTASLFLEGNGFGNKFVVDNNSIIQTHENPNVTIPGNSGGTRFAGGVFY